MVRVAAAAWRPAVLRGIARRCADNCAERTKLCHAPFYPSSRRQPRRATAAGTPGWVAQGNYTGGFIILDKNDPTKIIQRGTYHPFVPTMDYEIGDAGPNPKHWPVNRNRTLFVTSLVPVPGQVDTFRAWYGAADANVATAIVTVTHT